MKQCAKCKADKPIDEFGPSKQNLDGLKSYCHECRRTESKEYYSRNKEKTLKRQHVYYYKNREEIYKRVRLYPNRLQKKRAYYLKNRERIKKQVLENYYKRDRKKYSERKSKYHKKKKAIDPNYVIKIRIHSRIRNALKVKGVSKSLTVTQLIGCTILELRLHLENKFQHGMTWENRKLWEIDHIIPCALFDLTSEEEQKLCFHYTNMQPLWKQVNNKKWDKLDFSYEIPAIIPQYILDRAA